MLFSLVAPYRKQQRAQFHLFLDIIHSSKFLFLYKLSLFSCLEVGFLESAIQQRAEEVELNTCLVNSSVISISVNRDRDSTPGTESADRHFNTKRKRNGDESCPMTLLTHMKTQNTLKLVVIPEFCRPIFYPGSL